MLLFDGHVYHLLLCKVGLAEIVFQRGQLHDVLVGSCLVLQLTTFEAEESVRIAVALFLGDVLAAYLEQVLEGHHGTAHGKVEESFLFLAASVA